MNANSFGTADTAVAHVSLKHLSFGTAETAVAHDAGEGCLCVIAGAHIFAAANAESYTS
jgi:hypothetical protein